MADFNSVINDARQLSHDERLRLIDALWDLVPPNAIIPLHEDWEPELESRVAAIKDGTKKTVPWEALRAEALARISEPNQ